jgi:hypothetical protein
MSEILNIHEVLKRLSHSSVLLLHACPRKYQLTKLLARPEEESDDLTYGAAVGYGIQALLLGESKEAVFLHILFHWGMDIMDVDDKTYKKKKTIWDAFHALNIFEGKYLGPILSEYEIAIFNKKPAVELGFRINIGQGFSYRGYVDVVLINKKSRELTVLEVKTAGQKYIPPAKFQNSGQGLGYSLVCDFIAQTYKNVSSSSYKILYFVYKTLATDFEFLPFPKSHSQRAYWIKQLLQEVEHIQGFERDDFWPMYGESCHSWGRDCAFLNVCNLSNEVILKDVNPQVKKEEYTFDLSLMDLINAQLERHQEAIVL